MHGHTTWILIADAAHARALASRGPGHDLQPVPTMLMQTELPRTSDLVTDRLPRTQDSAGPGRHGMQTHSDPHRELKRAFAGRLAKRLDEECAAGAFDRLVIVAPAVTLGDLRAALGAETAKRVTGEVAKDLVHVPDKDIRSHLGDVVGV